MIRVILERLELTQEPVPVALGGGSCSRATSG
jgi:hypothetical protein